jgi:nicotinamide phosphoribosyltransferase
VINSLLNLADLFSLNPAVTKNNYQQAKTKQFCMSKPLHAIDFYKSGHCFQYPENTLLIYQNMTPRKSRIPGVDFVIWAGLQRYKLKYLVKDWQENFFDKPFEEVITPYQRRMDNALGEGVVTTDHIKALHDLGYLPLCIKSLPEGTKVPIRVPPLTIRNTVDGLGWLGQYLETDVSMNLWHFSTAATIAFLYRRNFERFYRETVGDPNGMAFIKWQGHLFADRGMPYREAAACTGLAHMFSLYGTDSVMGIDEAEEWYFADSDKEIIGGSIPATEHSVMCAGGEEEELETIRRLICDVYPSGPVSVVIDTYDYFRALTDYAQRLKTEILNRTGHPMGLDKVVFRPDSGDPADIICGTVKGLVGELNLENVISFVDLHQDRYFCHNGTYYEAKRGIKAGHTTIEWERINPTPEMMGSVECLYNIFGGTLTPLGYKQLNSKVGLIYGDSITLEVQVDTLQRLKDKGYASIGVVFGVGSFTYQHVTRDTFGWAIKATYIEVMEESKSGDEEDLAPQMIKVGRNIFKKPKTDDGTKNSLCGLIQVYRNEQGELVAKDRCTWEEEEDGLLEIVFIDGNIHGNKSLAQIRQVIDSNL